VKGGFCPALRITKIKALNQNSPLSQPITPKRQAELEGG